MSSETLYRLRMWVFCSYMDLRRMGVWMNSFGFSPRPPLGTEVNAKIAIEYKQERGLELPDNIITFENRRHILSSVNHS